MEHEPIKRKAIVVISLVAIKKIFTLICFLLVDIAAIKLFRAFSAFVKSSALYMP